MIFLTIKGPFGYLAAKKAGCSAVAEHSRSLDFIRLHRETQAAHSGIIVCTRDDADPTAFAQRIHSSLVAYGAPTGQLIRIVRPARG